jgi:hypothetical protein
MNHLMKFNHLQLFVQFLNVVRYFLKFYLDGLVWEIEAGFDSLRAIYMDVGFIRIQ